MKPSKEQVQPKSKKRDYVPPEIKKREQIKEVTEGDISNVTTEPA
jgi:hypothetical protein